MARLARGRARRGLHLLRLAQRRRPHRRRGGARASTSPRTCSTWAPSGALRGILLVTRVADGEPLDSVTGVFAGAAWHERETFEMFGIDFAGYDDGSGLPIRPLLLPDGFEGTPLRKSFQLAAAGLQAVARRQGAGRGPRVRQVARPPPRAGARRPPARVGPAMSVLEVTIRALVGAGGLPRAAAARRADRAQGDGPHAGPARPDVRRRLPRLGAARRRRREVRAEGGHHPARPPTGGSSGSPPRWR